MNELLAERIEHSFEGLKCSISVEAICWEAWKSDRAAGVPTPWEVLTELVVDSFATILRTHVPPHDVYKFAEPMAAKWVQRFGHVA